MWNYNCEILFSDTSESLEMTSSVIITFSLSVFHTSFFSIKANLERAVTLSVNKGSIVLKNVLAVTSVSLTLPKNVCFAFVVRVK